VLVFVPVVNSINKPLMPTIPSRARRWIKSGKATPFWKKGVFCVRLNVEPSDNKLQKVVVGIDPGSKREAYTVKSETHTYLNILSETEDWIKKSLEVRRTMRRTRRFRNCRRRECRFDNRHKNFLPPSTKARWALKLRICNNLRKIFPITDYIIEDIKTRTKNSKDRWNISFSPLEVGKKYFYSEISKFGNLTLKQGYETKQLRDFLNLPKLKDKLSDNFYAHNVDSWVLANSIVGKYNTPDNENMLKIIPLQFHRRQLHALQPNIGGKRRLYGGTMSLGFKRGSLVKHKKYNIVYVGGFLEKRGISLHSLSNNERICRTAKIKDIKFLSYNCYRYYNLKT